MIHKNVNCPLGSGEGGVRLCIMLVQSKSEEVETWFPNQNCELRLISWLTEGGVLPVSWV